MFAKTLVEVGFLDGEPGKYTIHDWQEHNPWAATRGVRIERAKKAAAIRWQNEPDAERMQTVSEADAERMRSVLRSNAHHPTQPNPTQKEKIILSELKSSSDVEVLPSKKPKTEFSREATTLAALLKAEILRNKADYKLTQAEERSWVTIADRMLRLDGRNPEQAAELIRWAQRHEFWMRNVLSMEKFRKQFDRLALEAKVKTNGKSSVPVPLPADYVSPSREILAERAAAVAR